MLCQIFFLSSVAFYPLRPSVRLLSESACQSWSRDAVGEDEVRCPCPSRVRFSDRPLFSFSFLRLCSQQLQIKHTVTEAEIQKLKNKVRDQHLMIIF